MKFISLWRPFEFEIETGGKWHFPESVDEKSFRVAGVSTDTRTLQAGELFVALKGKQFDGHEFVEQAKEAGAAALLVDHLCDVDLPQFVVSDTLEAFQKIGSAIFREATERGLLSTAITGSNGKTTTKAFTVALMERFGQVHRSPKNFNNHIGLPITLCGLGYEHKFLVFELGTNDFGEIDTLIALAPAQIRMIVSIGDAHLEKFKDRKGVCRAKSEIMHHADENTMTILHYDQIEELVPPDYPGHVFALYPREDYPKTDDLEMRVRSHKDTLVTGMLRYEESFEGSISSPAMMFWTAECCGPKNYYFRNNESTPVPSVGPESIRNMAFAMAASCLMEIPLGTSMYLPMLHRVWELEVSNGRGERLSFESLEHQLHSSEERSKHFRYEELRPDPGQLIVINDAYNANPTSLLASAQYYGKLGEKYREYYIKNFGEVEEYPYKKIAIIGHMSEVGDAALQQHEKLAGEIASQEMFDEYYWCGDFAEVMDQAARRMVPSISSHVLSDLTTVPDLLPPCGFLFFKASRSLRLERIVTILTDSGKWKETTPSRRMSKYRRIVDAF